MEFWRKCNLVPECVDISSKALHVNFTGLATIYRSPEQSWGPFSKWNTCIIHRGRSQVPICYSSSATRVEHPLWWAHSLILRRNICSSVHSTLPNTNPSTRTSTPSFIYSREHRYNVIRWKCGARQDHFVLYYSKITGDSKTLQPSLSVQYVRKVGITM